MLYDDLIDRLARAAPILFVLLTALVAHWLTVGRERRRDWLACCDEFRPILMRERDATGPHSGPLDADWDRLLRRADAWKTCRLSRAIEQYKQARKHTRQDEIGQVHYTRPEAVQSAVDSLLKLIR